MPDWDLSLNYFLNRLENNMSESQLKIWKMLLEHQDTPEEAKEELRKMINRHENPSIIDRKKMMSEIVNDLRRLQELQSKKDDKEIKGTVAIVMAIVLEGVKAFGCPRSTVDDCLNVIYGKDKKDD